MAAKDIIMKGSRWCIGNERKVHIWEDRWIPNSDSFKLISPRRTQDNKVMVSDLIDVNRRSWEIVKVRNTFITHEAELVLGIPISFSLLPDDSVIWAWTPNRNFTVKSAYRVAQRSLKEGATRPDPGDCSDNAKMKVIWKMVWQLDCPNKIKHFMWRVCKNILPTRNRLKVKGVGCEDCCALCGSSETSGHILWDCKLAKKCGVEQKSNFQFCLNQCLSS